MLGTLPVLISAMENSRFFRRRTGELLQTIRVPTNLPSALHERLGEFLFIRGYLQLRVAISVGVEPTPIYHRPCQHVIRDLPYKNPKENDPAYSGVAWAKKSTGRHLKRAYVDIAPCDRAEAPQ